MGAYHFNNLTGLDRFAYEVVHAGIHAVLPDICSS